MAGLGRPWLVFRHDFLQAFNKIHHKSSKLDKQINWGRFGKQVGFRNGPVDVQYLFVRMFVDIIRSDVSACFCMYLLVLEV